MDDRRVHAKTSTGTEVVRYDRAGKWYAETVGWRRPITFAEAVDLAVRNVDGVRFGIPGGTRFDAAVRKGLNA